METAALVHKVEQLPVETLTVRKYGRDFQIYPWLKSRWFHKVLMGSDVMQENNANVLWTQIKSIFYGFGNFFRKYDAWVFTNSSERTELEGKHYDKLFDYLAATGPLKTLLIEFRLFKQFPRKTVPTKYIVSRSPMVLLEEVYARLFVRKFEVKGTELITQIENELGVQIDVTSICRKFLAQYRMMRFFLWLLPAPKVVYLTVSYANFGYIRAFKERGIRVVEMQHGLIGEGHYAYYYEKEFDSNQFPDDVIVFGNNDKLFFEEQTKFPLKRVVSSGRYIIDYYQEKAIENTPEIRSICVSLQDGTLSEELLSFILKCDELLPEKLNWVIQTRRTPKEVYEEQFDFPANMQFGTSSVYEAIATTDAHLTIYSTTAVESLSIGKPTVLFDLEGKATEFLGKLIGDNPYVQLVHSPAEFASYVHHFKGHSLEEIAASNRANIQDHYKTQMDAYLHTLKNEVTQK